MDCGNGVYAAFCHMQKGSVDVQKGMKVAAGDLLGRIGHSGNSTAPHLHFQLMNGPDPMTAAGVPAVFDRYEVFENGGWKEVRNGMPKATERIRFE
jgi:murein DD-endopeptidase MepM/ murein hydrolase activator NlpD